MGTRCAVVYATGGTVINIVMAQPTDEPPMGCILIEIVDGQFCDIGWRWDGMTFVDQNPSAWSDTEV